MCCNPVNWELALHRQARLLAGSFAAEKTGLLVTVARAAPMIRLQQVTLYLRDVVLRAVAELLAERYRD